MVRKMVEVEKMESDEEWDGRFLIFGIKIA
jgi:hypothetical protein